MKDLLTILLRFIKLVYEGSKELSTCKHIKLLACLSYPFLNLYFKFASWGFISHHCQFQRLFPSFHNSLRQPSCGISNAKCICHTHHTHHTHTTYICTTQPHSHRPFQSVLESRKTPLGLVAWAALTCCLSPPLSLCVWTVWDFGTLPVIDKPSTHPAPLPPSLYPLLPCSQSLSSAVDCRLPFAFLIELQMSPEMAANIKSNTTQSGGGTHTHTRADTSWLLKCFD